MLAVVIVFIVLVCINMPIGFVIGLAGSSWFLVNGGFPFSIAVQRVVAQTQGLSFLAVPFFIFAGNLMNRTGITPRLLRLSKILTRRMVGGTAQVSVVLSTLMGGISGSAVADASMEARILGPEMIKRGYPKGYSGGVICLTSLITATIPPSLGLILYGVVSEVSIGRLFVAGIVPGFLMMVVLMTTVHFTAKKRGYDVPDENVPKATVKELLIDLKDSIWALLFPLILLVGIRFGIMTPVEAGAFAVAYALLVGAFIYKELTMEKFIQSLKDSFIDNGGIILIISLSGIFGYVLTMESVPQILSGFLFGITENKNILLVLIVLFLVVTGMFIDSNVNILLLTPILIPVLEGMGVNTIHFGVIMMIIVTMGCMTPPVGTALYTVCDILDCPVDEYFKETMPFYAAVIGLAIVLIFFEDVVMFLPNLIYG